MMRTQTKVWGLGSGVWHTFLLCTTFLTTKSCIGVNAREPLPETTGKQQHVLSCARGDNVGITWTHT